MVVCSAGVSTQAEQAVDKYKTTKTNKNQQKLTAI